MAHLFLDELQVVFRNRILWSVNRGNLSSFHRSDYHRPEIDCLEKAVRQTMSEQLKEKMDGRISILTHLRTFGYCFNPVTFYYLWSKDLNTPVAVMTEITNTPWGERYTKCFRWMESDSPSRTQHEFRKEFHVSPFIGMDVDYDWRFLVPNKNNKVDMFLTREKKLFFSAHLRLKRKKINTLNLTWALLRFPFMTLKVAWAIYWNAILLRLTGCPFYSHPKHLESVND